MNVISENRWVCSEHAQRRSEFSALLPRPEPWRIHVLGCARVTRTDDVARVILDGRHFDEELCQRLLAEMDRFAGLTSRIEFAVWAGAASGEEGWIHHTAPGVSEAKAFLRKVLVVVTGSDVSMTIRATPMRLERLLAERRGIFDEVLAAWLLDRSPGNETIGRLFVPERERPNEGVKVLRRFGDNIAFEAYRMATAHQWIEDQRTRMPGADLTSVLDLRLAQNLRDTVDRVQQTGMPILERVTGVFLMSKGRKFEEYFRLSLPLAEGKEQGSSMSLVGISW